MKILMTSIVDLKKSQHNKPHHLVKYLSKKHEISVLSINDWWKGGQEEACNLGVPCVTLQDNTWRPEIVEGGSNVLAGLNQKKSWKALEECLSAIKAGSIPSGKENRRKK